MQTETKLFAGLYYTKILNIIYDIHIIYSPINEEKFFLFINKSALKIEEKNQSPFFNENLTLSISVKPNLFSISVDFSVSSTAKQINRWKFLHGLSVHNTYS